MATMISPPSLVSLTNRYWDYFDRTETETFHGRYSAVLVPYSIAATATAVTAYVARLIYAVAQEGIPTAFLQWSKWAGERGAQIALLHSFSNYAPRMGLPASPWDDGSFALKEDITSGIIACVNWMLEIFHQ